MRATTALVAIVSFSLVFMDGARTEDALTSESVVREAQTILFELNFDTGIPDGRLGPKTRKAIEEWQKHKQLDVTGVIDQEDMDLLRRSDLSSDRWVAIAGTGDGAYYAVSNEESRLLAYNKALAGCQERSTEPKDCVLVTNYAEGEYIGWAGAVHCTKGKTEIVLRAGPDRDDVVNGLLNGRGNNNCTLLVAVGANGARSMSEVHQYQERRKLCGSDDEPSQKVADTCTVLIESGAVQGRELASTLVRRGSAFMALHKNDQADSDFGTALRINPDDAEAWVYRGDLYAKEERLQEALTAYAKGMAADGTWMWPFINRGIVYDRLEEYQKAEADFRKAIELAPEYAVGWANLCSTKADQKKYELAYPDCRKAIELEEDNPKWHGLLGRIYYNAGEYAESIEEFNQAILLYESLFDDFDEALRLEPEIVGGGYAPIVFGRGAARIRSGQRPAGLADIALAKGIAGFDTDGAAEDYELDVADLEIDAAPAPEAHEVVAVVEPEAVPGTGVGSAAKGKTDDARPDVPEPAAPAPQLWAAVTPNNEANVRVFWAPTEAAASEQAQAYCRAVSDSCASDPATTTNMSSVFATVCCSNPRLGCQSSTADTAAEAEARSRRVFADAGFTECSLRSVLSSQTGESLN